MKRLIKKNRGQSLVEMALVLPILLLLLLGIMEFGRVFSAYVELQNAARDGARYASIHRADYKDLADKSTWVTANLEPWIESRLTLLNPDDLSVDFDIASSTDQKDIWVTIQLQCPIEIITPIISSIIGNDGTLQLSSRMVMRSE